MIITGQLGIELWAGLAVIELEEELPDLKLGVLIPFRGFGENWNEENQALYQKVIDSADYVNFTSNDEYKHGGQLSGNAQFTMNNTDGLLLIYDSEKGGKPSFLYDQARKYSEATEYHLNVVNLEELQEFVIDYQEIHNVM